MVAEDPAFRNALAELAVVGDALAADRAAEYARIHNLIPDRDIDACLDAPHVKLVAEDGHECGIEGELTVSSPDHSDYDLAYWIAASTLDPTNQVDTDLRLRLADHIARELLTRLGQHGLGYILALTARSSAARDKRQQVIDVVRNNLANAAPHLAGQSIPETTDEAVRVAAKTLWGG